jgi:hypothetical protein
VLEAAGLGEVPLGAGAALHGFGFGPYDIEILYVEFLGDPRLFELSSSMDS